MILPNSIAKNLAIARLWGRTTVPSIVRMGSCPCGVSVYKMKINRKKKNKIAYDNETIFKIFYN